MKTALREEAVRLRLDCELSYTEIRKRLGVPKSTLSYWLHEFPFSEEKIRELKMRGLKNGEAGRERFRATMRARKMQKDSAAYLRFLSRFTNISREALFIAGLMLYWGEGDKRNPSRIGLANTDPLIITFFVRWLIDFLGVKKEDIRAELHLYENMDIVTEKNFWQVTLGFQGSQFYKTQIRKLRKGSFSYSGSYRHGTCSIFLSSVEKKREIMMAIKAFVDSYKGA